jgi:eukaryotic-like serine/threonine-protein kinase
MSDEETLVPEAPLAPRDPGAGHEGLQQLGRYLLIEQVGAGAMGVVYKAYDPELDRKVAIKLLKPDVFRKEPTQTARLRLVREAQAMARLSHPNVVPIHDVGTTGDRLFVAMEFVAGQTLRSWLQQQRRRPEEILEKFLQAGRGIAAAHAAGLLHRDFKPENVLLDARGHPKVSDFGLARSLDAPEAPLTDTARVLHAQLALPASPLAHALTQAGALLGTPAYMAPEQFLGLGIDARTEQFNFCAALWEALYGERAFAGDTYEALATAVCAGTLRPPGDPRDVPKRVHDLLLRGLARQREDRFESFDALLTAFARDPALERRPWVVAGAALLLLASGTAGALVWKATLPEPCPDPGPRFATVWSAAEKDGLRAAFAGTGAVLADFAAQKASEMLDDYGHRWVSASSSACRDAMVEGQSSQKAYAHQTRCLDRRLATVRQTLASLKASDARAVGRAQQAILGLPPIQSCLEPGAEEDGAAGPGADAAGWIALQDQVDRARSDFVLGMYARVMDTAPALAERAAAEGHLAAQAEALYFLGIALGNSDQHEAAVDALHRSVHAAEVSGADSVRALALISLAFRVSSGGPLDEAHRYAAWAQGVISRMERRGRQVADLHTQLHNVLAQISFAAGDYRRAAEAGQRALAHLGAAPDPFIEGQTRERLGLALLFLGRPAAALEVVKLSEQSLAMHGPLHPRVAYLHFIAAGALNALARPAEAEREARTSIELLEKLMGAGTTVQAPPLLALAEAVAVREPDAGIELVERALHYTRQRAAGGTDVTFFESVLGTILLDAGRPAAAAEAFTRALQWAQQVAEPEHTDTGEAHAGMGLALEALGRRAESERHLRTAKEILERTLGAEHPSLIRVRSGLGRLKLLAGAPQEARPLLEGTVAAAARPIDLPHVALARLALGELAWSAGDSASALLQARQARDELAGWGRSPAALGRAEDLLRRLQAP